tara:strand:+ start:235 stop:909 length:675 start_codon:yes stop_codon:yes gene_type:complete
MDKIDQNPNYKKIYQIVKAKFNQTNYYCHGPFDETYFSLHVYETAKKLIYLSKKKCQKEPILVAALLHDIGKTKLDDEKVFGSFLGKKSVKEWRKHAKFGLPITKKILNQLGHSKEFIEQVCYLIEHHDHRTKEEKTFELKLLQDADLIADWGLAGFIRPFLYGCKFRQSVLGSVDHIKKKSYAVSHEYQQLNLNISKRLGKQKLSLQKKLYQEIIEDSKSGLL